MAGFVYEDEKVRKAPEFKYDEPPDKYQQAALEERNKIIAAGGESSLPEGYTRRLTQGLGANWTDELASGNPLALAGEMAYRGTINPIEAYRYNKARENLALEKAREKTGTLGSAVEVLGGLATGGRAVLGGLPAAGSAAIRQAPGAWNAVGRYFGNAGKAGVFGGVSGTGEGDTLKERAISGAVGTVLGAGIGAVAPAVIRGASYLAQPLNRFVSSNPTSAFRNVDDVATAQIANTIERSGKTGGSFDPGHGPDVVPGFERPGRYVSDIEREVLNANAAGQPYILAEGIGTEGQRRLAGIAKSPGAARQWIDEDLVERDLGRRLRASQAVSEGLGVPPGMTAEMASEWLRRQAQTRSRPHYQAAEAVQPTWTPRMQEFFEYPEFQKALQKGYHTERGRALAEGRPFNPHDYAITQFDEAGDPIMAAVPNMRTINLMKRGIDELVEKHRDPLTRRIDFSNPQVQTLDMLRKAFLREVDSLNPAYRRARQEYAGPAQIRTAVGEGYKLPTTGQPADTIRRMQRLPETELQGTRIGLADRIATDAYRGTETGPLPAYLRNPKGRAELEFLSLHRGPRQPLPRNQMARASDPQRFQPDPIRRAIEREATMRQTFTMARGGSQTAENAADMLDTALPPAADIVGIGSNLLSGNLIGAVKAAVPAGGRLARGESEAQRNAMARILMERDPAEMAAIMQRIADLRARRTAAATGRAGAASGAAADSDINRRLQLYLNAP